MRGKFVIGNAIKKKFFFGIDDIKNGKLSFICISILAGSSLEDFYLCEISIGSRNFYSVLLHTVLLFINNGYMQKI